MKRRRFAQAASSDAEFGAKSIYNLAIQGDEPARRIFRTFGRYLGILLADLINVLNLDMYVTRRRRCERLGCLRPQHVRRTARAIAGLRRNRPTARACVGTAALGCPGRAQLGSCRQLH